MTSPCGKHVVSPREGHTSWCEAHLGARLTVTRTQTWTSADGAAWDRAGPPVELGLRRNPKRARLLVSRLLGKHIPVPVRDVAGAGRALGMLVRDACGADSPVVMGFAETATALGHAVAAAARSDGSVAAYLHTTRRPAGAGAHVVRFREEHSHAVDHQLLVTDDSTLAGDAPVVLVDDELSTGRSALNAIEVLQRHWPRRRYLLACLVDSRSAGHRAALAEAVAVAGADVVCVSLYDAEFDASDNFSRAAGQIRTRETPAEARRESAAPVAELRLRLPSATPTTAMAGWGQRAEDGARAAAAECAARLDVPADERTLVLGDEEFMYLPQLVAAAIGPCVRVSATTRSPAVVIDANGYPLRTALSFAATDDRRRQAYAYNVAPSTRPNPGNAPGFDHIVFVSDVAPSARVRSDVVAALSAAARVAVTVVTVSC